jgi:hypothetical protein
MATNIHGSCNKRIAYAWARYYEEVNRRHISDHNNYVLLQNKIIQETVDAIPAHIKEMIVQMSEELKKTWECPVCLDMIEPKSLEITNCGHYFCKDCIVKYRSEHPVDCVCPVCRRSISKK